jgi:regulator of protease activity HflC (stomatin/prohibitin superfamily)
VGSAGPDAAAAHIRAAAQAYAQQQQAYAQQQAEHERQQYEHEMRERAYHAQRQVGCTEPTRTAPPAVGVISRQGKQRRKWCLVCHLSWCMLCHCAHRRE